MPEVRFAFRWPDGADEVGWSPSRSIEDALTPGASYPAPEFLGRARRALEIGSDRVRARYGFACTASAAQIERLEASYAIHATSGDGRVRVGAFQVDGAAPVPPRRGALPERVEVVVVGGGQAGLSVSHGLAARGVGHVVLERHAVAHTWRTERWDTFCLVTPNWQCRLPGFPYDGDDPDGFMLRDAIVDYVERYAAHIDPPLLEGVEVTSVRPRDGGGFDVRTSAGDVAADAVVLAVGAYHVPRVPALAAALPDDVAQVHSARYKTPQALPDGAVLVVGSGQSGAQIAEDLHRAGRQVHLAVGSAPRMARSYRGRDVVAWMHDMGRYDLPIERHPMGTAARHEANHYVTGRDGGHDIDLRQFALEGMRLHGRLAGVADGVLGFQGGLAHDLDNADAVADRAKDTIDEHIAAQGIDAPAEDRYVPVWSPPGDGSAPLDLAEAGISSVVWATGFRSDWSWVEVPAFDDRGDPDHVRGVTTAPGLCVLGLPWLHTWGSGRFASIARDADHVATHLAAHVRDAGRAAA